MAETKRRNPFFATDATTAGSVTGSVIALIVLIIMVTVTINRPNAAMLTVDNLDAGRVSVEVQTANSSVTGTASITLKEGEVLEIRSELTPESTVQIEVGTVLSEFFTASGVRRYDLPAGHYTVRVLPHDGATGSMYLVTTATP